jgi:hypothetical protein
MVSSMLLAVESHHTIRNSGLSEQILEQHLSDFRLLSVDDDLFRDAAALPVRIRGADSIHLASAARVGRKHIVVATHDVQMAEAAVALGFVTVDPVTDDPGGVRAAPAPDRR